MSEKAKAPKAKILAYWRQPDGINFSIPEYPVVSFLVSLLSPNECCNFRRQTGMKDVLWWYCARLVRIRQNPLGGCLGSRFSDTEFVSPNTKQNKSLYGYMNPTSYITAPIRMLCLLKTWAEDGSDSSSQIWKDDLSEINLWLVHSVASPKRTASTLKQGQTSKNKYSEAIRWYLKIDTLL